MADLIRFIRKKFSSYIVFSCLKNLARTFVSIIIPILISKIITRAVAGEINEVLIFSLVTLSIKFAEFAVFCKGDIELQKTESNSKHICKMEFYKRFFDKPTHELFSLKIGETKEKINDDFDTIIRKYTSTYPQTITAILSAVAYLLYLVHLNVWIALIFFFISLLQVIPPILIRGFLQVNYDECRNIEAEITEFVVGGYRAFLLIKLYRLNVWWKDKLVKLHKKYSKIGKKSIYTGTAESILNNIVNNIITYVTYGIVGLLVLNNTVTLEVGIQSIAVSGSVFGLIKTIFEIVKDISLTRVAEIRLSDSLTSKEATGTHIDKGDIVISDLSFSYDGHPLLFSDLNIVMDKPELSAIAGSNGSGKTTLLYLISGVLKSSSGKVSIDNLPSCDLSSVNYPKELFFLSQEDILFNFTAMDLFDMMFPDHTEAPLKLAQRFGLSENLLRNSKISELSGGERKKVNLAVAFSLDPILMILDEPTNSLDITGKRLLKELLQERKGKTIIVTHDTFADDIIKHIYEIQCLRGMQ